MEKVSLPELPQLPEPLNSLMEGNHPKSKEFLSMIRKYDSSFQMTSFGTSLTMLDSTVFMPTFRIRGQVYHKPGRSCRFLMKKQSSSKYTSLETKKLKRNVTLVDMYAKIETKRLLFVRLNQKKLRVDEYIHLKENAIKNVSDPANHGKLVILPSTFNGCPRNMHEYAQDDVTYIRHGGKPSLFTTYTFNPNCKEMA
ncbi:hypothetical protein AVEN_75832-1 [Araneus ventricosus]|uniref:Helitron helicase-like domain-containing protein n=1 Tax=Araneus ventricosus TaxID=182803 RepID=A0A4Y2JJD0_ARAVE|nr:hypothetical protein AVEN_75832-1 [Araneus ventricosus]